MPASTSTPTTTLQLSTVKLEGPFESVGMAMGTGRLALEVVFARHHRVPANSQLQSTWKKRLDGRGVPLLLIVEHANKAYVCGPSGDRPQIYEGLDPGQVERICSEALGQPDRHAAQKSLRDSLGTLGDGTLAGLRNEGFLAAHELNTGVPQRSDWASATTKGSGVLRRTGTELLTGLGFTVDRQFEWFRDINKRLTQAILPHMEEMRTITDDFTD